MKKILALLAVFALILGAVYFRGRVEELETEKFFIEREIKSKRQEINEHFHELTEKNNTVEHEEEVYCGNTVTSVEFRDKNGEEKIKSFEGSDSIKVTDMLRYLNYCEQCCDCPAEYKVETEFDDYEVSLTKGFARKDGEQTALTESQVATLLEIAGRIGKNKSNLIEAQ